MLLAADLAHRVPGAISGGQEEWVSGRTFDESVGTGRSADSPIGVVTLHTPPGAARISVAPPQTLFSDDSDHDGSFAAHLARLPEPWWPWSRMP